MKSRKGRIELKGRIALTKVYSVIIIAALLFTKSSWSSESVLDLSVEYAGLVFLVIAAHGRNWSHVYICGRKKHKLVTSGPYSITRNPLYLFSFIGGAGFGLASGNIAVLLLVVFGFLVYYPFVIRAEEKRLAEIHGADFHDYAASVPLVVPRTLSVPEPERYEIYPRKFRARFVQSMWFIWAFIALQVVEKLHQSEMLPVFLVIP